MSHGQTVKFNLWVPFLSFHFRVAFPSFKVSSLLSDSSIRFPQFDSPIFKSKIDSIWWSFSWTTGMSWKNSPKSRTGILSGRLAADQWLKTGSSECDRFQVHNVSSKPESVSGEQLEIAKWLGPARTQNWCLDWGTLAIYIVDLTMKTS